MSDRSGALRRVGAAICACALIGGVLGGCAPKNGPTSPPTWAPYATQDYTQSAALTANLKALDNVTGPITGTMYVGGEKRTLSGRVTIKGGSTQIRLAVSGDTGEVFEEIVVGGHRYTNRNSSEWADRGTKLAGTDLLSLLKEADTRTEASVKTVGGVQAHEVISWPDVVDVAPALGLDSWTFDRETTTLRIWADDAGKVLGFGTSMYWRVMLGGLTKEVVTELDGIFDSNSPDAIIAPALPWYWVDDYWTTGIAYAKPGNRADVDFFIDPVSKLIDSAAMPSVGPGVASQLAAVYIAGLDKEHLQHGDAHSFVVAGEEARWLTWEQPSPSFHGIVALVFHDRIEYALRIYGKPGDAKRIDTYAMQMFASIEFTR